MNGIFCRPLVILQKLFSSFFDEFVHKSFAIITVKELLKLHSTFDIITVK